MDFFGIEGVRYILNKMSIEERILLTSTYIFLQPHFFATNKGISVFLASAVYVRAYRYERSSLLFILVFLFAIISFVCLLSDIHANLSQVFIFGCGERCFKLGGDLSCSGFSKVGQRRSWWWSFFGLRKLNCFLLTVTYGYHCSCGGG